MFAEALKRVYGVYNLFVQLLFITSHASFMCSLCERLRRALRAGSLNTVSSRCYYQVKYTRIKQLRHHVKPRDPVVPLGLNLRHAHLIL